MMYRSLNEDLVDPKSFLFFFFTVKNIAFDTCLRSRKYIDLTFGFSYLAITRPNMEKEERQFRVEMNHSEGGVLMAPLGPSKV